MAKPGDLIVVHLVDKVPLGYKFERRRRDWPLHITLAPWFTAADTETVSQYLRSVASSAGALSITVGEVEKFGAHKEVAVNIIEDNPLLNKLHEDIFQVLKEVKVDFVSTRHMGSKFRAHITRHEQDDHFRVAGEVLPFEDFHLIQLGENNTCEVIELYTLGYNK